MNDQMMQARLSQYGYIGRDPTVSDAEDAIKALKKRASELREKLSLVDSWKTELAQVERMLAAAEEKP